MAPSLAALQQVHPIVHRLMIASAIKPGQWYFQESLMECHACGNAQTYVVLIIADDVAVDAMTLWPNAIVDRNGVFEWQAQ